MKFYQLTQDWSLRQNGLCLYFKDVIRVHAKLSPRHIFVLRIRILQTVFYQPSFVCYKNCPPHQTHIRTNLQNAQRAHFILKREVIRVHTGGLRDVLELVSSCQRCLFIPPRKTIVWPSALSREETERMPKTNGFHWECLLKPPAEASGSSQPSQHIMKAVPWLWNDSLPKRTQHHIRRQHLLAGLHRCFSAWDCIPNPGGPGMIPGQGTRSHMLQL